MAVRDDFTAGEVLAAADLNDTFASKVPYAYGTATPSTTVDGFVWFDENSTPPAPKFWDGAAFQGIGGGKVLQVVRDVDTTDRFTTSGSFVDVTGMSVTITPQKSTSTILLFFTGRVRIDFSNASLGYSFMQITDSSNNAISGSESHRFGSTGMTVSGAASLTTPFVMFAYATPATTSAVTYKARFHSPDSSTTISVQNSASTGQMFAIEVAA